MFREFERCTKQGRIYRYQGTSKGDGISDDVRRNPLSDDEEREGEDCAGARARRLRQKPSASNKPVFVDEHEVCTAGTVRENYGTHVLLREKAHSSALDIVSWMISVHVELGVFLVELSAQPARSYRCSFRPLHCTTNLSCPSLLALEFACHAALIDKTNPQNVITQRSTEASVRYSLGPGQISLCVIYRPRGTDMGRRGNEKEPVLYEGPAPYFPSL
jgi:hypothetical protein